jgi:hypothetical protein
MKFLFSFISFLLFIQISFSKNKFSSLSKPEKCWVILHPFVAKKAFNETKNVLKIVDSIKNTNIIGRDLNGGKLDAFKHSYWMAALAFRIGKRKAILLGKAHEKGNYLQYKKHKLEDAILPDSVSCEMDLFNNQKGIDVLEKNSCTQQTIIEQLINAINKGELKVIKKNSIGNYLNCKGEEINMNQFVGQWNIPKCLVNSNE